MQRVTVLAGVAVVAVLGFLGTTSPQAQAPARMTTAVIDVQRILAESSAGKAELERIKKLEEKKATDLAAFESEIKRRKEKLTDMGFSIKESERTKLQREIEDKVISGERFRKDSLREIKGEYQDVLADFERRIGPIIEQIGADRGIELILHRDNPAVAWASLSIDVTPEVIERFNKAHGSK